MNQNLSQIKNMMNTVKSVRNPNMMLNTMMSKNPMLKQAYDFINNNGGDPEKAFYSLAKQMGVDPNEVLNALK